MSKLYDLQKENKKDTMTGILVIVALSIVIYLVGLYKYNIPGVYFDSALADFHASELIFPMQSEIFLSKLREHGFPLLGGVYYGLEAMFLQLLLLPIAGSGSVLTLRGAYLFYDVIIAFVIYLIDKKIMARIYALLNSLVFSTSILIITVSRSQYDIMLPGIMFMFLSVYIVVKSQIIDGEKEMEGDNIRKWMIIGAFNGLSFYCYFVFLFFVPAFLYCILRREERKKTYIISFVSGFLSGSILYFYGFGDALITRMIGLEGFGIYLLMAYSGLITCSFAMMDLLILNLNKISEKSRTKLKKICVGGLAVVTVCFVVVVIVFGTKIIGFFVELNSSLGIFKAKINFLKNLFRPFFLFYSAMSNCSAEIQMMGKIKWYNLWIFIIFIVLIIVQTVCWIKYKQNDRTDAVIKFIFTIYISGYLFCIPLAHRMQEQHFVPLVYLSYIQLVLILYNLIKYVNRIKRVVLAYILLGFILINLICVKLFFMELSPSGGIGLYSQSITNMCYQARDEADGTNTYVFANNGFHPTFVYLTDNKIRYMVINSEDERLKKIIHEAKEKGEKLHYISNEIHDIDIIMKYSGKKTKIKRVTWRSGDGRPAFYECILY